MYKYAQTNVQLYRQIQRAGYSSDSLRDLISAYCLASVLFSAQYRANGKPFVCHLVGTASILAAYHAPWPVVLAGLLHAVYAQGNFGSSWPKTTISQRKRVRDVIGDDAEELIRSYTGFQWSANDAERLVEEVDELNESERSVVLMRIANELEEAISGDILFEPTKRRIGKAQCLSCCGQLAEALGWQDLAKEINEVFQDISICRSSEDRISKRHGSYLQPPLSHRARLGPFSMIVLKSLYYYTPKWLRLGIRALTSKRDE